MNKVFENDNMVIHDDRVFITPDQAFEIIWNGRSIMACDPPNFSAENEYDVHSMPFPLFLQDCMSLKTWEALKNQKISIEAVKSEVVEYLRGYEISE